MHSVPGTCCICHDICNVNESSTQLLVRRVDIDDFAEPHLTITSCNTLQRMATIVCRVATVQCRLTTTHCRVATVLRPMTTDCYRLTTIFRRVAKVLWYDNTTHVRKLSHMKVFRGKISPKTNRCLLAGSPWRNTISEMYWTCPKDIIPNKT